MTRARRFDAVWPWVELVGTVVLPLVVFTFGAGRLPPRALLALGLAAPLLVAVASVAREGRPSALALLALGSVVVTGGIGLLELDTRWFAIKELVVPVALGGLMGSTALTRQPLLGMLLERLVDPVRLEAALARTGQRARFAKVMRRGTWGLGGVTAVSGPVTALVAQWIVRSPAGTDAFSAELGRYTGWSFVLVTLPALVATIVLFQWVIVEVEAATGAGLDDLLHPTEEPG